MSKMQFLIISRQYLKMCVYKYANNTLFVQQIKMNLLHDLNAILFYINVM